jgi:hypothetical protein
MKWLEIIELRFGGNDRKMLKSKLYKLQETVENSEIKVYSHVNVKTDFSIHLTHYSEKADPNGSTLGQHLVSTLKEFGLVNHNVWIEMHKKR